MNNQKFLNRKRRVRARITGTAERPRASVFRSLTSTNVQLIDDTTGKTLAAVFGKAVKGKTKTEQAIATGKDIAALAQKQGIKAVIFDRSGYRYHGRLKALAEAMREGGLSF